MHNAPNPLIQKLIKDLAEARIHVREIQEKLTNPNLFEEIEQKKPQQDS